MRPWSSSTHPRHAVTFIASIALVVSGCGLIDDASTSDADQPAQTAVTARTPSSTESGSATTDGSLEPNAEVLFIVDGDTVEVDIDGVQESIRFIGIDTPEKTGGFRDAECFGDEASERMRQLISPGDGVYLELDEEARDRFDRLLAYVYRADDGEFLNLVMVEEGFAAAFPFEPNTLYADVFDDAEDNARDLGLGLWGVCGGPDLLLEPAAG